MSLTPNDQSAEMPISDASCAAVAHTIRHLLTHLVGILALLCSMTTLAAEYPSKISFQNLMAVEDIALGEVEAIFQDHEGFIWLGGRNDLLRFDGQAFLSVPAQSLHDNTQLSPLRHVLDIFEDHQKTLWVASHLGLLRYNRDKEIFTHVKLPQENPNSDYPETINALAETPDGRLLVGSANGLYILDTTDQSITAMRADEPIANSLPSKIISDIYVDAAGAVWLAMHEGLVKLKQDFHGYTLIVPMPKNPKSLTHNSVKTITQDHDKNMWFGTDYGVFRFNPTTEKMTHFLHNAQDPKSLANNISRHIYVDHQGWVWTGSDQGGISLFNAEKDNFIRFQHIEGQEDSLSSNTVRRIYEDINHDIWIGTYPSGVNFYDRSSTAITHLMKERNPDKGLLKNNVEALEIDSQGNLWIGAGGITRYNLATQSIFHYQKDDDSTTGSPSTSILNGFIDSDGGIQFGSWGHGIIKYDAIRDRFIELSADTTLVAQGFKEARQLNDKMVWSLYEDSQKTLWISTHFNGLTRYDRSTELYTFYPPDDQNPFAISNPVTWLSFEDSNGRFWVGTSRGLNLMDREKGTFKIYLPDPSNSHSLANGSILSIYEDSKNQLWFGTDEGLHLYRPQSDDFIIYNHKHGFLDDSIRVITEDASGNLWLGTNNGIILFNAETQKVRNFSRHNGKIIGGVATGAGVTLPDGRVAFGSRSGVYIFDAAKLLAPSKMPPIVFTDFRLFTEKVQVNDQNGILKKTINHTESLTLKHTHTMVSIGFAALSYREPSKNQYAYKLEGFDDDWRQTRNQRHAIYTNLPAGTYTFHVKASNNDGIWNSEGRQIIVRVLPPPWKTWWAYLIYTLLALMALLLFLAQQRRKVNNQLIINQMLEVKVEERTNALQQSNQELITAYEKLEKISISDPLTGLYNRRHLRDLVPRDAAKVQRIYQRDIQPNSKSALDLTFFILDIDFFKPVNDFYGHSAGDKLLVQISQLLTATCRESDCCSRWGGEEFMIVSRFADRREAQAMAERLRAVIENHEFEISDETTIKKTCSIGFASYPFITEEPEALTWEQVIDLADQALYAAKNSGRNRSVGLSANAITPINIAEVLNSGLDILIKQQKLSIIGPQDPPLTWQ